MKTSSRERITVETSVQLPVGKVWELWTLPKHITRWNFASPDWHCPQSTNDLKPGGRFSYRMEAKDGSMGFDFGGVYNKVSVNKHIECTLDDGRDMHVEFTNVDGRTKISETFEAEEVNSIELQKTGWQAILDNFKRYSETKK
jgi:uncharacterized protein YndB with AHSA1/START domain